MRRKEIIKSAWDLISYGMQQAGMSQSEIEEYLHNNQKDISNFIEKKFSKYKTKKRCNGGSTRVYIRNSKN